MLESFKAKIKNHIPVKKNKKYSFCFYNNNNTTSKGDTVICVPFTTTAVYPFSFPFGRGANLNAAIDLKFRGLIGDLASSLSMAVQVTKQSSKETRGAAWFTSKYEIERYMNIGRLIPVPIAFLSEVNGTGLVIWQEDNNFYALWAQDYEPKFYRWFSNTSTEEIITWMRSYAQSVGGAIAPETVMIFKAGDITQEKLQQIGQATFEASPSIADLCFTNNDSGNEQRDRVISGVIYGLKVYTLGGLFFLTMALLLLAQGLIQKNSFALAPSRIYRQAMGEESRAPLSSITRQLKNVSGSGTQMTFDAVLGGIASAWKVDGIQLNALRYGLERTELEMQARNAEGIQKFRDELSKNGFSVRLGEVQQILGSNGLRFTVQLSEGGH